MKQKQEYVHRIRFQPAYAIATLLAILPQIPKFNCLNLLNYNLKKIQYCHIDREYRQSFYLYKKKIKQTLLF